MIDILPSKADIIIIDADVKSKLKLVPSMFLRCNEGQPAIAIVNQKLQDIFKIPSGDFRDSIQGID